MITPIQLHLPGILADESKWNAGIVLDQNIGCIEKHRPGLGKLVIVEQIGGRFDQHRGRLILAHPAQKIRIKLQRLVRCIKRDVIKLLYTRSVRCAREVNAHRAHQHRRPLGIGQFVRMVAQPYRDSTDYPLQEWDVITKIGDMPIDSDGKVPIRYDLRLSASYLVQKYAKNGTVPLTVYRDGRLIDVNLPVLPQRELVIPYLMDKNPRFFIFGPFVFAPTTQDYLERLGNQQPPTLGHRPSPLVTRRFDKPAFENEELVVVAAPLFPSRITKGYDDPNRSVVSEVNGTPIKNLRHLVEILRDNRDERITFKFASSGVLTHASSRSALQHLVSGLGAGR